MLRFHYDEIKLWEIDATKLLKDGLVGIYPLLSLTRLDEPKEEKIRQMVSEIKKIPDRLMSMDMLFAFKLLGSIAHPTQLLETLIRREDIMESPLAREIYEEGMQEGIQKGMQEGIQKGMQEGIQKGIGALRASILEILNNKFDFTYKVGKGLENRLSLISNTSTLQKLLLEAVNIKDMDSFIAILEQAEKVNEEH